MDAKTNFEDRQGNLEANRKSVRGKLYGEGAILLALREAELKTQLAITAVIMAAALLISFVAGLAVGVNRAGPGGPPEIPPADAVPAQDIPGEDVPGLQRYPGAVRVKYESHLLGDAQVWEVGYLVEGRVHEAVSFYSGRLDENGWSFEGSDFDAGEHALRARRGEVELVVELEQVDELVEIEMELSEPLSS